MGDIWRINVQALLKHYNMKASSMAALTGRSASTLQHNFGPAARGSPSLATVHKIERAFHLTQNALSHPNFNPVTADSIEPTALAMEGTKQLATLSIPIPDDKLERILRILNE